MLLNLGINIQDGFHTSHLERTFYKHEADLIREYLGAHVDIIETEDAVGKVKTLAISRQLVLFAVERRKSWRMLQSKAGVANINCLAQKQALASFE